MLCWHAPSRQIRVHFSPVTRDHPRHWGETMGPALACTALIHCNALSTEGRGSQQPSSPRQSSVQHAGCLPSDEVPCRNRQTTHGRTRVKGRQRYKGPCSQSCIYPYLYMLVCTIKSHHAASTYVVCTIVPAHRPLFSGLMCQAVAHHHHNLQSLPLPSWWFLVLVQQLSIFALA